MAVLLQSLCIKLGVVTGRDLAQACRKYFSFWPNIVLYLLCEAAIIATDVAEVIGTAIALNLLFHIPLPWGVVLTALDVLLVLVGWKVKYLKIFEGIIITLVFSCAACFAVLLHKSHPDWRKVALGFVPSKALFTEKGALYIAMGIIGATVMPHNLYLHSSIVKYRASRNQTQIGQINEIEDDDSDQSDAEERQPITRKEHLPVTLRMTLIDCVVALCFALLINAAILIVAAAAFYETGRTDIAELSDAFELLKELLGNAAGYLFAVALLFAGQSSTITGTMAGQIVMMGFLGSSWKVKPWVRQSITRVLAIAPSMAVALIRGDKGVNELLVLTQVILSIQLPFAVWPLVYFTSSKRIMTVKYVEKEDSLDAGAHNGSTSSVSSIRDPEVDDSVVEVQNFANGPFLTALAIFVAIMITVFNVVLLVQVASGQT
ncbi:hypothetical protein HK097_007612 [Rhizophlyctis rosea]|uniref:Natural resistance-associated macrophage protein n=1 Tax=Rhizophlyctis rosea TaxID=64517 RepID=A0AAD5SJJ1_9FUNG|nr:hypothetical protein HK097_007612 [Rhizophlyctis rosea]